MLPGMPYPTRALVLALLVLVSLLTGCSSDGGRRSGPGSEFAGHLLIIGGGLDDDTRPVYERFIALASAHSSPPSIVIATAASGDQEVNATGKIEAIRAYCPAARIEVIKRETPAADAVALIDRASAMFFTGGDQKRITALYRPDGADGLEAVAMRRLLARGGVIAGTSAGDAMMSNPMFLTGRSADALGIARDGATLGPQIGPGMAFLPWAMTESHFFERNRFGRLVAGLEASGRRLGIGVGEDAAVEVDLARGEVVGLTVSDSLLVDVGGLQRRGLTRSNIRTQVIRQGMRVRLTENRTIPTPAAAPTHKPVEIPAVEAGQNRQLASWRFFLNAQQPGAPAQLLKLDGYEQEAWSDGRGGAIVEIRPLLNP